MVTGTIARVIAVLEPEVAARRGRPRGAADDAGAEVARRLRLIDVLRDHASAYLRDHAATLAEHERRVLERLLLCRTPGLGGHDVRCTSCDDTKRLWNGCRDRHCPTCPAVRQLRWLEQRKRRALDVPHFHVVFSVPAELRLLIRANQRRLYVALMQAAAATTKWACARALGADVTPAFSAVLHTWNRALEHHPHVHVVLAQGGLSRDDARWVMPAAGKALLAADDAVRAHFRDTFLRRIRRGRERLALPANWDVAALEQVLARAARRRWYLYSKRTLSSVQAYSYLARYTRRVGASSSRLRAYDGRAVKLGTREGRTVTLPGHELVRRFLLHVLPPGFVRIRHHGLLVAYHAPRHAIARQRIDEQGLGCGHAAELEGADDDASDAGGDGGDPDAPWQELCARSGFDVRRCARCQGELESSPIPASLSVTARLRDALLSLHGGREVFDVELARAARAARSVPPNPLAVEPASPVAVAAACELPPPAPTRLPRPP